MDRKFVGSMPEMFLSLSLPSLLSLKRNYREKILFLNPPSWYEDPSTQPGRTLSMQGKRQRCFPKYVLWNPHPKRCCP